MLLNNGRNPYRYRCENIKHRENSRIESASESLRAAKLKCIRSTADRVCLHLRSGSAVSSNYRWIQPIVTRFPPENRVRLSEANRMRKEGKTWKKKVEREKEWSTKKTISCDGKKSKRSDFNGYPQRRHLETVDSRVARIGEIENSVKRIKEKREQTEMQIKRLMSLERKLFTVRNIFYLKQEI